MSRRRAGTRRARGLAPVVAPALFTIAAIWLAACGVTTPPPLRPPQTQPETERPRQRDPDAWKRREGKPIERGIASWYGPGFAGRLTANGEIFDPGELTAAHKTLPFGTWVRVVNLDNGREVVVRINDRGPFIHRRIIDLSRAGAEAIGMIGPGVARVRLFRLEGPPQVAGVEAPRGRFTVQVGAFHEAWRAHVLRGEIAGHFPEAEIISDAVWHRVQVGRFGKRERAEEIMRELVAQGYPAVVLALGER